MIRSHSEIIVVAPGTNTLTNNSAKAVVFASDMFFSNGGGFAHTLVFTGSGDWLMNANLKPTSGTAFSVTKNTAGTLILDGTNGYTGATSVTDGKLIVNGNISTSTTTVSGTGTLGGGGTVATVIVQTGGTLAPGNSIDSLGINGDLSARHRQLQRIRNRYDG